MATSKTTQSTTYLNPKIKKYKNWKKIQGNRPLTLARTDKRPYQYLYSDSPDHTFMNNETYEQINIPTSILGNALDFIVEGDLINVVLFEETPVTIELPISVILKVVHTEQAVRGDTTTNVTKTATLNTGMKVQVPLFIEVEENIKSVTMHRIYGDAHGR